MEDSRLPLRTTIRRRRTAAGLVALVVLAVAAWLLLSGGGGDPQTAAVGDVAREQAAMPVPAGVMGLVDSLDKEELAEQVLLVGFEGTEPKGEFVLELRERQLGGVLVGRRNWLDAGQGTALVQALRAAGRGDNRIPPLVVTAQEGGEYRALADLPPEQTELQTGNEGDPEAAENWALETATALADAGFDLNLFPVADVAALSAPISDRAFSDDPVLAAQMTAAAIRGCREAQLGCAVAHFPGLGGASQDTARGPATVSLDAAGLSARDLEAFRAAFAERAPATVLSLAFYAAYDPVTPGALAEPVATGLLRDQLGYEGAAITDDLGSGAVRSLLKVPDAAVEALAAGADLIQIGDPEHQNGVADAVVDALESGELSEARLRQAAGRVLELKRELGLVD
jgi:beta-N-acetylhexosaminidase